MRDKPTSTHAPRWAWGEAHGAEHGGSYGPGGLDHGGAQATQQRRAADDGTHRGQLERSGDLLVEELPQRGGVSVPQVECGQVAAVV
jgi:hypothetical protein